MTPISVIWQDMIRDCPVSDCFKLAFPYECTEGVWSAQCPSGHVSHPEAA